MGYVDETRKKVNDAVFRNQIIKKKRKYYLHIGKLFSKSVPESEKWLKCAGKTGKKVPGECCLN